MHFVSAGLVTGGRTGHRFKDQLTAKIASKLWPNLTYVHNPFPNEPNQENLWEMFLGSGDDKIQLSQLYESLLNERIKLIKFDTTAWTGLELSQVESTFTKYSLDDHILFFFTESARILLEQVNSKIRNAVVEELRQKYQSRRKTQPIQSYFDSNLINVAIHIRRGPDVAPGQPADWRATSDSYYLAVIENLRKILPKKPQFHIYSEGDLEILAAFKNIPDVQIHSCPWGTDYQKLFENFHHMITADILVNATSDFSYMTSHYNPNITITLPVRDVCKLPDELRHIKANSDGSFDVNQFQENFK